MEPIRLFMAARRSLRAVAISVSLSRGAKVIFFRLMPDIFFFPVWGKALGRAGYRFDMLQLVIGFAYVKSENPFTWQPCKIRVSAGSTRDPV
jgi:hypothetical protein